MQKGSPDSESLSLYPRRTLIDAVDFCLLGYCAIPCAAYFIQNQWQFNRFYLLFFSLFSADEAFINSKGVHRGGNEISTKAYSKVKEEKSNVRQKIGCRHT